MSGHAVSEHVKEGNTGASFLSSIKKIQICEMLKIYKA